MKKRTKKEKRQQVVLEIPDSVYRRIEYMQKKAGLKNKGEVLRNALRLYDYVLAKLAQGETLKVVTTIPVTK
ncbi:MAG: hypothetical protein U0517_03685 [Candidatus Andersenbacteria bacterium]